MIYLITGGTGSLGQALAKVLVKDNIVRIYSRDEFKQSQMFSHKNLRFFIGDVRDKERLRLACKGVDIVIHCAALKQVPSCEYNPFEAVKTNIIGTQTVIEICGEVGVKKALFISSDKAVDPINLYGATKLVAEKLWLSANQHYNTKFSLTRWGNVISSRGSVIPLFEKQRDTGVLTVTDYEMTRFWITLKEAVSFVLNKLATMKGGEIFIPDLKSCAIIDLAKVIAPKAHIKYIGIREGEKLHESLGEGYFSNDPKRLLKYEEVKSLYESL
jgi:UDP-N-acetylglucosamine 4,6-dehydratase